MQTTRSTPHVRLEVHRRAVLADRILEPGDVIDFNAATGEVFVAAGLPFLPAALRDLLLDGAAVARDTSHADALSRLEGAMQTRGASRTPGLRLVTGDSY